MSSPMAARRDRFGRRFYPIPDPKTKELHDLPSWSRLKGLLYSGGLETWKLKSVARTVARRSDLQMLAADEDNTYSAVQQALDASREKSNVGTAVHKYTEYIDAGTLDRETVPPVMAPWLARYEEAKAKYGWTMVETEATVYNLTAGYAGTADRFVNLPGVGVVALDLKTGAEVWAETALQLAAYSGAEGIWVVPADTDLKAYSSRLTELDRDIAAGQNFKDWGSPRARKWSEQAKKVAYASLDELYWEEFAQWPGHRPMPEGLRTDIAYVVHLSDEKCDLVPMTLDGEPSAHEAVRALCTIFNWQQREKDIVGEPLSTKEDNAASDSTERATAANAGDCVVPADGDPPADETVAHLEVEVLPSPARADSEHSGSEPKGRRSKTDPTPEWLVARITALPEDARNELASLWPSSVPTFRQTHDQTLEQLQVIDQLLARIEAEHELPFVFRPAPAWFSDTAERARLIERLQELPEEVIERITARKNASFIPNMLSPSMSADQALALDDIIQEEISAIQGEKEAA